MRRPLTILVLLLLLALGGGAVFLTMWDIPPPTRTIETPVFHDRPGR